MHDGTAAADEDSTSDADSDGSVEMDVEGTETDDDPTGSLENTTPPHHDPETDENGTDETVPTVELDLYDLSVRVSGQSTDDLDRVSDAARDMMDYLVDQARALEDQPDDRGLS